MIVVDEIKLNEVKTRVVAKMLNDLGVTKSALMVLPTFDDGVVRASRNIRSCIRRLSIPQCV